MALKTPQCSRNLLFQILHRMRKIIIPFAAGCGSKQKLEVTRSIIELTHIVIYLLARVLLAAPILADRFYSITHKGF